MRFVPLPGPSSSGDQVLGAHTAPGGPCVLITSPVPALGFPSAPREHCHRCAMCLLWGADLRLWPSWQMSTVQDPRKTWLATGSLLTVWWRMPPLGPRLPLAFGSSCHSLEWGEGAGPQPASSPLVFAQSFVLWVGQAAPYVRALHRKILSFSLSLSLAIPQFGLLSHVSSLRLSSGHSGLVVTLSVQPAPSCPAPASWWWTQVSGLLLRCQLWLGTYFVDFFFLPFMLPSEFPKVPTDPPVRRCPAV